MLAEDGKDCGGRAGSCVIVMRVMNGWAKARWENKELRIGDTKKAKDVKV